MESGREFLPAGSAALQDLPHQLPDGCVRRTSGLREVDVEAVFDIEHGQRHLEPGHAQVFGPQTRLQLRRRDVRVPSQQFQDGTGVRVGKRCW